MLREELLSNVSRSLVNHFNSEDIDKIKNILIIELSNYEISERYTDVATVDNTTENIIQLYLSTLLSEGKSINTVRQYKKVLGYFFDDVKKPFNEIGVFDIRPWLAKREMNASKETVDTYRRVVSTFFRWLKNEEIVDKDPSERVKKIKVKVKVKDFYSPVDIDSIRSVCKTAKQRVIVELLLSSGIRANELCHIKMSDVNFQNKSILIREGKGDKERIVYFNDICAFHMNKYLSKEKKNDCEWLIRKRGGGMMNPRNVGDYVRSLGKQAHVNKSHPHKFRHTFATVLRNNGADLMTIQALLGHSNISTTQRYISINNDSVQAEYKRSMTM